jgi:hypothetical protein
MSEVQPNNSQPVQNTPPEFGDRWEERRRRREERRAGRGTAGAWLGGVIIIAIGIFLLLQNVGMAYLQNWWALFIFIPAAGTLAAAWYQYKKADMHLNRMARTSLISGLVLVVVAVTFLLNWSWAIVGPILLIVAGLSIVLNYTLPG